MEEGLHIKRRLQRKGEVMSSGSDVCRGRMMTLRSAGDEEGRGLDNINYSVLFRGPIAPAPPLARLYCPSNTTTCL